MKIKNNWIKTTVNFVSFVILICAFYSLFNHGILPFIGFLIFSVGVFTPRIIYSKIKDENLIHPEFLSRVEILVTSVIILNTIGYMWLFKQGFWYFIEYDTFVHFVAPILFTLIIAIVLGTYYNYKNKIIIKSKFVLNLAVITVIYTLLWEVFEYALDTLFHSGIYGQEGQSLDTFYDVSADLLSIPVSSVIIYKYYDYLLPRFKKIKNFVNERKTAIKKIKDKIRKN